jgi:glycosyltransferase involved in cell wall biosynthesis
MKLLGVCADFGGSSWYRIIQPIGFCQEIYEEAKWSLPESLPLKYLQESDMVIIQRQCHDIAYKSTQRLLKLNKIIVSEIDDNIWSIPPDTENMYKFWTRERIKGFEEILKISHAVTVSTPRLAKMIKEYNKNVYVLPNLVVFDRSYVKPDYGKIRIGWAGSESHMPDFTEDIQDALLDIKKTYKDKIDIFLFGINSPKLFTKVSFYPFIQPHLYLANLQKIGMDIGIVPNRQNLFNDCRSNLKFLEYSAVRAVTIASSTESYKNSIINGQNGLLLKSNSRKSWYNAIRDMIENPDKRQLMADRAFDYCYKNYSVQEKKNQYQVYGEIINKVQGG